MAEVLGIFASIIAVIQLAGQVTSLSYGYIGGVSRAPKDLQDLVDELYSLGKVLATLRGHIEANSNPKALQTLDLRALDGPTGPLQRCAMELEELRSKLEPRDGFKGIIDSLKWPFKEKDTLQYIARIERHKSMFILVLTVDQITRSRAIEESVQVIKSHVENTNRVVQAESAAQSSRRQRDDNQLLAKKRKKVMKWIHSENFDVKHLEISGRRQKDTGNWLLKSAEFQAWVHGQTSSRLLWGHGIPGAGKTFLSSVVIEHFKAQLAEGYEIGLAYVYFDYKEQERQAPIHIISSLLKQLINTKLCLPAEIEDLYDRLEPQEETPTLEELYAAMQVAKRQFQSSNTFLIFDALDECHPETQRKILLPLIQRMEKDGFNIFLTSRPHPEDIQDALGDAMRINLSAHEEDIVTYIQGRIDESPRARRLIHQGRCKDRIISELVNCAKGMFLLIRFHIDYLCQQTNAKQILAALDKLKSSGSTGKRLLDPIYARAIENIKRQDKSSIDLAFSILSWLVMVKRTLTVEELQAAVAIEKDRYELDEMDLVDRITLVDVCAGLVVIDEPSDTIKLAHYTVQEYLIEKDILPADASLWLATACTTYLSFSSLAEGPCSSPESLQDRLASHPFLQYAANHITIHLRCCDENLTTGMLLHFLESSGNINSYCQIMRYNYRYADSWNWYRKGCLPLHVASAFGHLAVVRLLLEKGASVFAADNDGRVPLHEAAKEGHLAVVRLLLEKGANVLAADKSGWESIHHAVSSGHEEVVRLLLRKGADILATDTYGRTALHRAAAGGHQAVASLLIDQGAEVSAVSKNGRTPLHYAASEGHGLVELLVERGAEISATDKGGLTPLHHSASKGHKDVVSLLLEKGADISAADKSGWTPVHHAASEGHEVVMNLLYEKGADISAVDTYGRTPLHRAAARGRHMVVSLLLKQGAQVSSASKNGRTPLHHAASGGHEVVVRLLLGMGADVSAVNKDGWTPLHHAASRGHQGVANLLLLKGADASAASKAGQTPLHQAASRGYEMVSLLLEMGAQVSAVNKDQWTPLHHAASGGHETVVRLLLDRGVDVLAVNKDGWTPLHHAASRGHEAVVSQLLERGADISAVSKSGQTALRYAVLGGHSEVISLLLEKDDGCLAQN